MDNCLVHTVTFYLQRNTEQKITQMKENALKDIIAANNESKKKEKAARVLQKFGKKVLLTVLHY